MFKVHRRCAGFKGQALICGEKGWKRLRVTNYTKKKSCTTKRIVLTTALTEEESKAKRVFSLLAQAGKPSETRVVH